MSSWEARVICEMIGGPADGQCADATDDSHPVVLTSPPPPGERHVYRYDNARKAYVYEGVQFRGGHQ